MEWIDMTLEEKVAKAIRDAMWAKANPPVGKSLMESLPLTEANLAVARAAIKVMVENRGELE